MRPIGRDQQHIDKRLRRETGDRRTADMFELHFGHSRAERLTDCYDFGQKAVRPPRIGWYECNGVHSGARRGFSARHAGWTSP